MPRLVHRVPKYARQKSSGLAYVKIDGSAVTLCIRLARIRSAYDRLIADLVADRTAEEQPAIPPKPRPKPAPRTQYVPPPLRPIPISEVVLRYFEHAEAYYRKTASRPASTR